MSGNERFSERLAVEVAGGASIVAAAVSAGCSEGHARRISAQSQFRLRVAELRSEVTAAAVGKLTTAANLAVDVLIEPLAASNEPKDRLNAAKATLNALAPMSELHELRARLDALEHAQRPVRLAQ